MVEGRQDLGVGFPLVGMAASVVLVTVQERNPQAPGRGCPATPSTQATMWRKAHSTASQRQTLRWSRPTKVHISSSFKALGLRRWAFFDRRRGNRGEASAAFLPI